MHLLNTASLELSSRSMNPRTTEYVILSHRWETQTPEVMYQDAKNGALKNYMMNSPGYRKVRNACAKAKEKGYDWIWVDTCCINKSSSTEESEAINSMFDWYTQASVCFAYLKDVSASQLSFGEMKSDWLLRGWTLQETMAPKRMEFYDMNWGYLGTRTELAAVLSQATGIQEQYLNGSRSFREASVAAKFSWMAGRRTERIEDMAYSLLGIFDINMTPQYGEGEKAFRRLTEAIISTSIDESIFAWTWPADGRLWLAPGYDEPQNRPESWGLLAPSPKCFAESGDVHVGCKPSPRAHGGIRLTHQGVNFPVPRKEADPIKAWHLIPVVNFAKLVQDRTQSDRPLTLNCWRNDSRGKPKAIRIWLHGSRYKGGWSRGDLGKLDLGPSKDVPKSAGDRLAACDYTISHP